MTVLLSLLFVLCSPWASAAAGLVHHELRVRLLPQIHTIEVEDRVSLPSGGSAGFALHPGLSPTADTAGVMLRQVGGPALAGLENSAGFPVAPEWYRVELPAGVDSLTLRYRGEIHHPLSDEGDYARGFRQTPGTISSDGVFLSLATAWVPWFGPGRLTFGLSVDLPAGWDAVSQGRRGLHQATPEGTRVHWEDSTPQEEVYLIASRFREYSGSAGPTGVQVFLRRDDPALAAKYLEVGGQYLRMYADLLGAYPYPKFALVENFWETGYGMPSFSLLGPRVIRFPFILHSSYPHEILHNWWGNGVYVDWQSGNWCEGLTAYLADHLIREGRGQGAEHRQTTLQKYADYVSADPSRDFPLVEFRSRHSSASEAVGYGKSLMFYHMLRRELGDGPFVAGLRRFYREQRFRTAGFNDLRASWEVESGADLSGMFDQWIVRSGAPRLELGPVGVAGGEGAWRLDLELGQAQRGEPYRLAVPVAVTTADGKVDQLQLTLDGKEVLAEFDLKHRPVRVDVDPEFDLFRLLDPREIPPALSGAFGAERVTVVLPSGASKDLLDGYRELAGGWARSQPGDWTVVGDDTMEALPADAAVWVLGWENRWRDAVLESLAAYDAVVDEDGVGVGRSRLPRDDHSFVLVGRHSRDPALAVAWLAADRPAPLPGLGRKLPHYHKYSQLAFEGGEPENVRKGRWPVVGSPLSVQLEPGVERGPLAERTPLAELPPAYSTARMGADLVFLTAPERQGRGFGSLGLDQARDYLAAAFEDAGLARGGDDGYLQCWSATGGEPPVAARLCNVVGVLPGTNPAWVGQSVVLGAHYDHLGLGWPDVRGDNRGRVHPGADDNASGVAVLLELARTLAPGWKPERSVVFVAFAGEEAGRLGSRHYVAGGEYPVGSAIGMVNLDTVGRLGDGKLLALGTGSAREWVHIFRGAGFVTGVPIETVTDDVGGSDQVSFVEAGVPAVQLFSGPHDEYHRPGDTADKVDLAGLVRVAEVTREVVEYLAGRPEPLTVAVDAASAAVYPAPGRGRRASLGTVPDFTFPGPGVRLDGVVPGSPAEAAGLRRGDVLIAAAGSEVSTLADLSRVLKQVDPGSPLAVRFRRDGEDMEVEAALAAP